MKIKIISLFAILSLLTFSTAPALAGKNRQAADWNALRNHLNTEIAVKARNKNTVFGVLRAVETDSLTIQIIRDRNNYETVFAKNEIEKVWRAQLRGGRNAAKGALIGAGVGAGIGLIGGASASEPDPLNYAGVPLFGLLGAGLGALIGGFSKKSDKKKNLIYKP